MHGTDLELVQKGSLRDEGTTKEFTMNPSFREENHTRSKVIITVFTIKHRDLFNEV